MTIKKRLKISYIAMLVMPIILILFTGGILRSLYLEPNTSFPAFFQRLPEMISIEEYNFSNLINEQIIKNPELILDINYLKDLEKHTPYPECGLIVLKNEETIYITEKFDTVEYVSMFAKQDAGPILKEDKQHRKYPIMLFKWNFKLDNSDIGTIILLFDWREASKGMIFGGVLFTIFVIIIIVLTNGILTYHVSKSIIDPLNMLKSAATKIKNGELDSEIIYNHNDEIKEVVDSFEQMRKKLKESLENQIKYEENRRELISNISHDLRTPITAIKGYIEGIRDGVADSPEKIKKYMNTISVKADVLEHLIEELFLFSKLDLKKVQFDLKEIDLISFIKDCLQELHFDYKNITINYNFNDISSAVILADPNHLKRVISNIVDNADKYNDKDKTIINVRISEKNDNFYKVEIKDNGRGISEESLPYIFERLYREDFSRNTDKKGSGLGLSITRQIIEGHGGKIRAESEPGKGTAIIIELRKIIKKNGKEKNINN